jgi:mercuric ion transport protein
VDLMERGGRVGLWAAGAALFAVICCAGPALVALVAGLGLGAWTGAHAGWLTGLAVVAVVAGAMTLRRRHARRCRR